MVRGGLFVLLSLTTNPQKHTERSDVIFQAMGANEVKISSIFTAIPVLTTQYNDVYFCNERQHQLRIKRMPASDDIMSWIHIYMDFRGAKVTQEDKHVLPRSGGACCALCPDF